MKNKSAVALNQKRQSNDLSNLEIQLIHEKRPSLLSKLVLHIVRFKRNLNLKKNEEMKVCCEVFSNLHM